MQRIYPLLFVFLWSTGFIGAKYGLPYAEPLSFLFVRYLAVIALMTAIALLTRAPWPKAPMQWVHIGVSGLLVHAVYLGGVFIAIKQGLPAGITALVVGMQPLLTALGAGWLLGERVVGRTTYCDLPAEAAAIATVGGTKDVDVDAVLALLGREESMSKLRGKTYEYKNAYLAAPIPTIVTYHPSYLLRQPTQKRAAWQDMLMIQSLIQ